ncbi:hypothetical protein [Caulobacter sp. CCG-8]|uniref:hypothetical protein n=1 Tax=Caulobacter sp. CCG-8 TaxID=3127958 RepID=UPI00307D292D
MQLHTMISLGLAVGTTVFAVKSGDRAARRFGVSFLASWVASLVVSKLHLPGGASLAIFCIDSATLVYFAWASLDARRIWTAVATAFILLIVASHVATAIDFRVTLDTFRLSMALWSYGILACIGFGAWSSRRDQARTPVLARG